MILVLDASAMIAFLRDEPGAAVVEAVFTSGTDTCIVHAINLCEVYYDFIRSSMSQPHDPPLRTSKASG